MSKLTEKFIQYTLENELDFSRSGEHNAKQCEQITDAFAVKFYDWTLSDKGIDYSMFGYSTEVLLQIFKNKYYETN